MNSRALFEEAVAQANKNIEDPVLRLGRGVAIYARMSIEHPLHARFIVQAFTRDMRAERSSDAGLEADLSAGLAAGALDFATLRGAVNFVGGVVQALVMRLLGETAVPPMEIVEETLVLLLRAFGMTNSAAQRAAEAAVLLALGEHEEVD